MTAAVRLYDNISLVHKSLDYETYKFAPASAILMVDLYPASIFINPEISFPMYFNFAQSRKLVLDPPECAVHLMITASKSLHALPQGNRGRLRSGRLRPARSVDIAFSRR